jgi:AAA15 family ATPase/GTPase
MFIKKMNYYEFANQSKEWKINDFTFSPINLIVGRNAVGKTRTLRSIASLAALVSEKRRLILGEGNFEVEFNNKKQIALYQINIHERKIMKEKLIINGKRRLERDENGLGKIYYKIEDRDIDFQIPLDEVATISRRDPLQHPYLEDIYNWGDNLVFFQFGQRMGQDQIIITGSGVDINNVNIKQTNTISIILESGIKRFEKTFKNQILADIREIGYILNDIDTGILEDISFSIQSNVPLNMPPEARGIIVKERDINDSIGQHNLSQGMFRSLSLIIQLNYFLLQKKSGTILIDDIGEGLDFERSSSLIRLLIKKASKSNFQLIMTTNDRFVMNNVPFKYWSILDREGGECFVYNNQNSKKLFDEFELMGLNNFDLFSTNFYKKQNRNS